jgi:lactoylglutathione lyase
MAKITGIAHVAITVKDMKKSLDFYTRLLGFKRAFDIPNPENGKPWIEYIYVAPGQFIELFYDGTVDNPWRGELRGFNHLCVEVDDIHSFVDRLKKEGVTITDNGPHQGCDNNSQAWIMDPDGIRVELMMIDQTSPHAKAMKEFAKA